MASHVQAYLEHLPQGLDSYPECQAKASLYRGVTKGMPVDADRLPAPLRDLVLRPRPVTDWIPEVHSHAILLAQYDQYFNDTATFTAHSYREQRALWSSKLYSFMMRFATPRALVRGASSRWSHFHRGTALTATETAPKTALLELVYPAHVYCSLTIIGLTEGIRALLDTSAVRTTFEHIHHDDVSARWVVQW